MKCPICNNEHNNKKYCSRKCQYESYKKEKVDRIIVKCLNCNNDIRTIKTKPKKYCSRKCCDEHKKIIYKGENNPLFGFKISEETRKKHSIASKKMWKNDNIAKKIKESIKKVRDSRECPIGWDDKSRQKRINTTLERYGFVNCSMNEKCRKKVDKTCLEKYGKTSYELMIDGLYKTSKTSIEKIIETFLINNNIKYKSQYRIYFNDNNKLRFKIYDFYLQDKNFLIEVDGDYWHGNPNNFKTLNETQIKNIKNDYFKNDLAKLNNIPLIRLWETDIHNNNYKNKILNIINDKN